MKKGFEVDFLPVGNGEKSGDAIAVRYGTQGDYKIMVVDGGTKDSGKELVDHIQHYYGTTTVDYVVNTHPDADHASGLSVVLEQLEVKELWIHRPWNHSEKIRHMFKDGRITDNSLSQRLKESLNAAYELETIAVQKGVVIHEPFQGAKIGDFTVLSPSKTWYLELVPIFEKTPEEKTQSMAEAAKSFVKATTRKVMEFIGERWDIETLREDGETSAENLSSVVLYADFDGELLLLTGDAGIETIHRVADYAEHVGLDLQSIQYLQVPHHGSRNNVSPSALNRLLGSPLPEGSPLPKFAYVSASKESSTHPRRVVTNAFQRRGARVFPTRGQTLYHSRNMPERTGWSSIEPIPFFTEVEK